MKPLFLSKKHNCKTIRQWIGDILNSHLSIHSDWVRAHIVNCPRCQQRLTGFNRVALGLHLIKTQIHHKDLLKNANQQTLMVLHQSVRQLPQAQKLRQKQPRPKFWSRMTKYTKSISHAAACFAILLLMKFGIFTGMEKFQSEGQKAVHQYYVNNIGEDLTDDIFMA